MTIPITFIDKECEDLRVMISGEPLKVPEKGSSISLVDNGVVS